MAKSSGRVTRVRAGEVKHAGVTYSIDAGGTVRDTAGAHKLEYFIGSGAAGRSYLTSVNRFLFEAPVTWYSQRGAWDVSPGYEGGTAPRWNRPIEPSCLRCHASQVAPVFATQNRYLDPPFRENGISCERCHGPGSAHVEGAGKIVLPTRLTSERRDAVCSQCHLTGEARIEKAARSFGEYRPGDALSSFVAYFTSETPDAGVKATSHVERLTASRCKQASGDMLWCGSCHDPHRVPAAAERVSWYRGKCLACHESSQCARGPDCTACHMPRARVVDGGHGVLTDHSIPRDRKAVVAPVRVSWRLAGADRAPRELGLAYAEAFSRTGDPRQGTEAARLLSGVPLDAQVATRLAAIAQAGGDAVRAKSLYQHALRLDPHALAALVNTGVAQGQTGNLDAAIGLWRDALKQNPGLSEAARNLAAALIAQGRKQEAAEVLQPFRGEVADGKPALRLTK